MTEDQLEALSIDDVCALMITRINEYLLLDKLYDNKAQLEAKRAELKTLHRIIGKKMDQRVNRK